MLDLPGLGGRNDRPPAAGRLLLLLIALLLPGCDYLPGSASPAIFENTILRFEYPANWQVAAGGASGGMQYVVVTGPSSTEVIFQVYPRAGAPSLREYADWFSAEFSQQVSLGRIEQIVFTPVSRNIGGLELDGIREHFELRVLGLGFPHSREYFAHHGDELLVIMVFQISDHGAHLWAEHFTRLRQTLVFF